MKGRDSKRSTECKRTKKTVDTTSRPRATPPAATQTKRTRRAPVKTGPETANKPGRKAAPVSPPEVDDTTRASFPIVAIGASAGGLEAVEQFLKHVPEQSGMAFVVIQHLDPTHKGLMAELLQRVAAIPVVQVQDKSQVEPDHVYVIPPNKDMSILHGILHLLPRPPGLNLPIDFFFRSLAEDQRERSVGVVLSGMGSDGTLGLRAIKEKAGATFVQALTSAKFNSMPCSAIEAGLADVVAPVEELPAKIMAYRQHAPFIARPDTLLEEKTEAGLEKVFVLLRTQTGNDFSLYKRSTIYRRVERRMGLNQIHKIPDYVRFLRENPGETELLFKELLIGVTNFFRDPPAWEQLKSEMATLVAAHPKGGTLRAWVPGCSTGEEAYSLAILFKEVVEQFKQLKRVTLQIFATDLDAEAIEKARAGVFPPNIAADVSPERLSRFFMQDEHGYRVAKAIRELVVFAPQNIIMAPPFTKLDILSCRNLLIYLSSDLQKKLIPLFHYCLNPSGVLLLGSAETIGSFTDLFSPLAGKTRLYRHREASVGLAPIDFPSSFMPRALGVAGVVPSALKAPPTNLQILADRTIAMRLSPPVVLTNDQGDIVYISRRTGKYLEPAVGKINVNIFAMAREGLRYELSKAFSAALKGEGPAMTRGVKVGTNGGSQTIDLTVEKLIEPKELAGMMMIVFTEVEQSSAPSSPRPKGVRIPANTTRLAEMSMELRQTHEELQSSREKMQTSQEELKSANEEMQSTNEELQSTNEELTTSKEEMQSMNEELQTVNRELQAKLDELSQINDDMKNLLNSTEIATLFLDDELRVRRFTPQAANIIKLIPGDAGRPFTDIVTTLDYPEFADDAKEVLRTLISKEKMAAANDNRWFSVRIMPYRTLANVIAGLVITFVDASTSMALESALRKEESELRKLADSLPQLVWSSRADGAFDYLSHQWIEYTGIPGAEQLGDNWLYQIFPDDRERVRAEWIATVKSGAVFDNEFRLRSVDGTYRWFKARAAPIRDAKGLVVKWYGTSTDINDLKPIEATRRRLSERAMSILEGMSDAVFSLDRKLSITYANAAAERLLKRHRADVLGKPLGDVLPEAGGAICDKKYRHALEEKVPLTFDLRFEAVPTKGWYGVRIFPQEDGVSIFFQQQEDGQLKDKSVTKGQPR